MIKKNDILKILEKKEIKYTIYEHEPFYTVEDSNKKRSERALDLESNEKAYEVKLRRYTKVTEKKSV